MAILTPNEIISKVKSTANLRDSEEPQVNIIKINKPGKLKFQIIAPTVDVLFKPRTLHFIQPLPDNDDPNEKVLCVECQKENCPICTAFNVFKNSGITVDEINAAYPQNKYPYTKIKSFITMQEHYLLVVRVLADQAEDGYYLPKDEEIGSTQILQLSKTALNSLMTSYQDYIDDLVDSDVNTETGDYSLFGIYDNDSDVINSLSINLRVTTSGQWQYIFTFNKAVEVNKKDIDVSKRNKENVSDLPFTLNDSKPTTENTSNSNSFSLDDIDLDAL